MSSNTDNKVYVDVLAIFTKDGRLVPSKFVWEDGREYEITRITGMPEGLHRLRRAVSVCDIRVWSKEKRYIFIMRMITIGLWRKNKELRFGM